MKSVTSSVTTVPGLLYVKSGIVSRAKWFRLLNKHEVEPLQTLFKKNQPLTKCT